MKTSFFWALLTVKIQFIFNSKRASLIISFNGWTHYNFDFLEKCLSVCRILFIFVLFILPVFFVVVNSSFLCHHSTTYIFFVFLNLGYLT